MRASEVLQLAKHGCNDWNCGLSVTYVFCCVGTTFLDSLALTLFPATPTDLAAGNLVNCMRILVINAEQSKVLFALKIYS